MGISTCFPNLGPEGNEELFWREEEEKEFPENELLDGALENEFKFEELEEDAEKTFETDDGEDGEEKEDGEKVGEEGDPIIVWKCDGDGEREEERSRIGRVGDWDPDTVAVSQTPNIA